MENASRASNVSNVTLENITMPPKLQNFTFIEKSHQKETFFTKLKDRFSMESIKFVFKDNCMCCMNWCFAPQPRRDSVVR